MHSTRGVDQLRQTLEVLLGEQGCQWDREQSHESLVRYLIEEVYELVDAIESGDRAGLREELGDVLYQVLFHAEIAARDPMDAFDIDEVASRTNEKMRSRHPHVFDGVEVDSVEQIRENWLELKRREKPARSGPLEGIPASLQGIARAQQVIDRAGRSGREVPNPGDHPEMSEQEWGEWLLGAITSATSAGVDLDRALRLALKHYEHTLESPES